MTLLKALRTQLILRSRGGVAAARSLGVEVGSDCRVYSLEFGTEPWLISIGDRVTVSSRVAFLTHDGVGWLFRDSNGRRYSYKPIVIGNDVFVGLGSILLPGVTVGSNSIIGSGSVVTKSVAPDSVVAGNPARQVTTYTELMSRVAMWPSDTDLGDGSYRERIQRAHYLISIDSHADKSAALNSESENG